MSGKKKTILTVLVVVILAVLIVLLGTLIRQKETLKTPTTNTTYSMGTVVTQSYYSEDTSVGEEAVKQITSIINKLDEDISWRKDASEVAAINKNGDAYVSQVVYDCLKTCIEISKDSDGAFDLTVGKLSGLWNIGTEDARLPSDEEIDSVLPTINYSRVILTEKDGDLNIEIGEDQKLDFGAVGKGLACDEALKYLETTTITGSTVSVGGSILVYGENPTSDDGTWNIGVRDPNGTESDYMAVINTTGGFFSTSGDYEKVLEVDGKKYHHILDPKTGYPAESNLTGVTIYANSGLLSDALSTAVFILGYSDESLALLEKYDAEALFITKDNKIYITDGLKDCTTIIDDSYEVVE